LTAPRLIALTGYAGSGKSTMADILACEHGFTVVKFAGPLKDMLRVLGLGDREIEGDLKEQPCQLLAGHTPRRAMQTLGTEWGRDLFGQDFWVGIAMHKVRAVLDQGGRAVIDDCRFPNEVAAIKAAGGVVVRIVRPGVGPVNAHASEAQQLQVDGVADNGGSMAALTMLAAAMAVGQ
jgi:hypothetical protein